MRTVINRMTPAALATAAAMTLAACAANPAPVPVYGTTQDISHIEGEWAGDYWSHDSGRSGSIWFRLTAETDTAVGSILMVPADEIGHDHPGGVHPPSEYIPIEFVLVRRDHVEGRLTPYRDPACGCRLDTTFEGEMKGDTIAGTFRTRHIEGGSVQTGRWSVTRVRP